MARKGILTTDLGAAPANSPAPAPPPTPAKQARFNHRGAVGALQSSLSKMQENAVQDLDAALIDDAGIEDRLGVDGAAQRQLRESLATYGQQVPVLVRPHTTTPGRYEIVYGRRRLKALRELGLPVKAMVRQLDDHALVMAQGQENTARQDLSFIEKASFAAQLQEAEYDRPTIAAALSMDLPMVSRMLKVGTAFDLALLRKIGSAPGIGRDRWMMLVDLFKAKGARARVMALTDTPDFAVLDSDGRFEAVLTRAKEAANAGKPAAKPTTPAAVTQSIPLAETGLVARVKHGAGGFTLTVPAAASDGFDSWLAETAPDILKELHDRWANQRREDG